MMMIKISKSHCAMYTAQNILIYCISCIYTDYYVLL